ncbi:MAG: phosphocholine cytidylyltransferase family protein [Candidatus Paceibacterota bacterium]|jgi:phosphoenolpyruvate phosphomutase
MKAIVLAAGMGTRLGKYTENLPKGMLSFAGKSLIERQINTLRSCGIEDITIVKGYAPEKINFPGIKYYVNENFAETNMVETLFKAEKEIDGDFLVLYSDVICEKKVIEEVLKSKADIGVTVDVDYWDYWKARLDDPEEDTESLIIGSGGNIVDLGDTNCTLSDAKVRYVGIIRFSKKGAEALKKVYHEQKNLHFESNLPWMRSKSFKKAYMTCMLKALIDAGYRVDPIFIKHGWLEFDTVEDYERATAWNENGTLQRFINLHDNDSNHPKGRAK